jgi:hypothetical protein
MFARRHYFGEINTGTRTWKSAWAAAEPAMGSV